MDILEGYDEVKQTFVPLPKNPYINMFRFDLYNFIDYIQASKYLKFPFTAIPKTIGFIIDKTMNINKDSFCRYIRNNISGDVLADAVVLRDDMNFLDLVMAFMINTDLNECDINILECNNSKFLIVSTATSFSRIYVIDINHIDSIYVGTSDNFIRYSNDIYLYGKEINNIDDIFEFYNYYNSYIFDTSNLKKDYQYFNIKQKLFFFLWKILECGLSLSSIANTLKFRKYCDRNIDRERKVFLFCDYGKIKTNLN